MWKPHIVCYLFYDMIISFFCFVFQSDTMLLLLNKVFLNSSPWTASFTAWPVHDSPQPMPLLTKRQNRITAAASHLKSVDLNLKVLGLIAMLNVGFYSQPFVSIYSYLWNRYVIKFIFRLIIKIILLTTPVSTLLPCWWTLS